MEGEKKIQNYQKFQSFKNPEWLKVVTQWHLNPDLKSQRLQEKEGKSGEQMKATAAGAFTFILSQPNFSNNFL